MVSLPGFFALAKNVAKYSDVRIPMGAVIVGKKPISVGFNSNKTHPLGHNSFSWTIHAEHSAILSAGKDDLSGSKIFVYRESRKNRYSQPTPALARPCENCMELLRDAGIREVWYTIPDYPFFKKEKI